MNVDITTRTRYVVLIIAVTCIDQGLFIDVLERSVSIKRCNALGIVVIPPAVAVNEQQLGAFVGIRKHREDRETEVILSSARVIRVAGIGPCGPVFDVAEAVYGLDIVPDLLAYLPCIQSEVGGTEGGIVLSPVVGQKVGSHGQGYPSCTPVDTPAEIDTREAVRVFHFEVELLILGKGHVVIWRS